MQSINQKYPPFGYNDLNCGPLTYFSIVHALVASRLMCMDYLSSTTHRSSSIFTIIQLFMMCTIIMIFCHSRASSLLFVIHRFSTSRSHRWALLNTNWCPLVIKFSSLTTALLQSQSTLLCAISITPASSPRCLVLCYRISGGHVHFMSSLFSGLMGHFARS